MTLCGDNWLYEEASLKKIRVVLAELSEKTMMSMFTQHQNQSLSVKKGYFRSTDMFYRFGLYTVD